MKKVLFASTALVAFASAAAAEVTLSGRAEMGIFDTNADDVDPQFHTDIDVTFTMSGETDGGLVFGASVDLDEEIGQNNGGAGATRDDADDGGATIFLSGGFGTITMGDTDGALDWAVTEILFNSGSLRDDEEHGGYFSGAALDGIGDGQILRYDYTVGDFAFALSAEQQDNSTDDAVLGIGFKYGLDFGGTVIDLGIGYQASEDSIDLDLDGDDDTTEDVEAFSASANATFGAITAGLIYADAYDYGRNDDYEHIGVGVGYSTGAIALHANYGDFNYDDTDDVEGFGLTAGYDLGGGAQVQFGYGSSSSENDDDDVNTYSFGVAMSF